MTNTNRDSFVAQGIPLSRLVQRWILPPRMISRSDRLLRQPNRSRDNSPSMEALANSSVAPGERLVRKDDNDVCSAITRPLPNIRDRLLSGSFCVGLHRDCTNHGIRRAGQAFQNLHRICWHDRVRRKWWRGRFAGRAAGGGQNDSARQ